MRPLDDPRTVRALWVAFLTLLGGLAVTDLGQTHHAHFPSTGVRIDAAPVFFPVFGLLSCVFLVLLAKVMAVPLKRRDDFYER